MVYAGPHGLRVGVAGAGRVGHVHIQNLVETPRVTVVAVCTVVPAEQELVGKLVPSAKIFRDFDSFIATDFDLVIICTPTTFHYEHVAKALKTGKHVFCEKPLGPDASTAWAVYEEALKYPSLKVACGFPRRFASTFQETALRVKNGDLGEIISVRSQSIDPYVPSEFFDNYIETSGGIFVDMTIHDIDVCLYLFGTDEKPIRAFATGSAKMFPQFAAWNDVDDAFGLVEFESGKVMALYGNRDSMQGHHAMAEIAGTKGRIIAQGHPHLLDVQITDSTGVRTVGANSHMELFITAFKNELRAMRDWILDDVEPAFNLKDAAKAVTIASALTKSLHENQAVDIVNSN
ncbi:hypothetical protein V1505DRAFT_381374 [Lipomyces doorenjongii]